jgi:putative thiamine transport system ATP-binding protein
MALQVHVQRLATARHTLVQNLRIDIPPGCVHTLMGPSGCGKSSLLAAVCGTLDPALQFEGEVLLNGRAVQALPAQQRRIGILFQDDLLFAHMNVLENLLFALPQGPRTAREALARQALADVEMAGFEAANPATLSGGQRSRVALARALLAQPQALLLDEPFTRLDTGLRQRMRALVFGLVAQRGIPALLVTHDVADVADGERLTDWTAPKP